MLTIAAHLDFLAMTASGAGMLDCGGCGAAVGLRAWLGSAATILVALLRRPNDPIVHSLSERVDDAATP